MAIKQINLRLDESLLTAIDDMRGLVPRNAWIKDALEQRIGGDMTVSYEYTQAAGLPRLLSGVSRPVTVADLKGDFLAGLSVHAASHSSAHSHSVEAIGSASSSPVTPGRVSPKLRSGIKPRPKGTTK
jgi:hypothetical protein